MPPIRQLITLFTRLERRLLAIFTLAFLAGSSALGYQQYLVRTTVEPSPGGRYVEGVVGNRAQLADAITRLTSVGLVSLNEKREYVPVLASEWTISPDGKTYRFHLRDTVDTKQLAVVAQDQSMFKTVEISASDAQTLTFTLKQPFGPFLSLLALPIFPYGPFLVAEEKETEVRLLANEDFPLGRPYLDEIDIRTFPDELALRQSISRQELTGVVTDEQVPGWQRFDAVLPRKIMAIFNTEHGKLGDLAVRNQILHGASLSEQLPLTIVTSPQLKEQADRLSEQWKKQNIAPAVTLVEDAKLLAEVIPGRNYDVLLYGLDAGIEPDPYRFWHSSQNSTDGLNLAGLKDKQLDTMLEEARKMVNDGERFAKYQEIDRRLDELSVGQTVEELRAVYQLSPKMKGVEMPFMVTPGSRYNMVWKWYTKERRIPQKDH